MNKPNKILCSNSSCSSNPFCSSLENTTREYLCKMGKKIKFKARQDIMIDLKSSKKAYLLAKGQIFVIRVRENGRSRAMILNEGDILGITQLFGNHITNINHLFTKTQIECCIFSIEQLEDMCCKFNDFACKMIDILSKRLSKTYNVIEHLTLDTSEEKLLYILETLGYKRYNVDRISYTHEELAQLAGLNRVTVTRALEQIKSIPKNYNKL
ncbi:MAG: Crp/Fnr family transcriptional regulator [Desulfotomaculaceae bacterium]|nr:Crp/Fnr family transcriptional regulator [Desulfotomaculaceae bacterium]